MKKYQVFISSTFEDLQNERKEIMQALLELDCIPAGMELFQASDDAQWELIKRVIDSCDYYIVIIAGRYGSIHPVTGKSFTHMEYEYALSIKIPIVGFIHKNPNQLPYNKVESSQEGMQKLIEFKKLVSSKLIRYWETAHELGGVVSRSIIKLIDSHPRAGWVKADDIHIHTDFIEREKQLTIEINRQKTEIEQLKSENDALHKQINEPITAQTLEPPENNTISWDNTNKFFIIHDGSPTRIKVMGVGGCGNNIINYMIDGNLEHVEFIAVDTDFIELANAKTPTRIKLGETITRGQGTGGKLELGCRAAEETKAALTQILDDTDMLFIIAGMGGGTGTGAAPYIAQIARKLNILTVGIVIKSISFKGSTREYYNLKCINDMLKHTDSLIVINNQSMFIKNSNERVLNNTFINENEFIRQGIQSIASLINTDGYVNLDFADITTVMKDKGLVYMGIGYATGVNRLEEAAAMAIANPLLDVSCRNAKSAIINIIGDPSVGINDIEASVEIIRNVLDDDACIMFGCTTNDDYKDKAIITVIASDIDHG